MAFVVASDDMEWTRREFKGAKDVYFSGTAAEERKGVKAETFDRAILLATNHNIIGYVGTLLQDGLFKYPKSEI